MTLYTYSNKCINMFALISSIKKSRELNKKKLKQIMIIITIYPKIILMIIFVESVGKVLIKF